MILNFEQIKEITIGAESVERDGEGIKFYRFTKSERELYSKRPFYEKTFSTAGVGMEFETDGDGLRFQAEVKPSTSRSFFSVDVFANEKFVGGYQNFTQEQMQGNYVEKAFALGEISFETALGRGDKRVKIFFPWSVCMELKKIEIPNATYLKPVKKSRKMLAYGDSITHGYDAAYPSAAYVTRIAKEFDCELYNKAIGGEVFFPALAKAKGESSPDYILVAYGTNDFAVSEFADFTRRCREFFKNLTVNYPNSLIFAITPIWRADCLEERSLGEFSLVEKTVKAVCSEYENVKVISGFLFLPQDTELYSDLRLHPNDKGFEYYFKNLTREMKKYIP